MKENPSMIIREARIEDAAMLCEAEAMAPKRQDC